MTRLLTKLRLAAARQVAPVPRWVAVTCFPPEAADFHDVEGQGYIWIDSRTGESAGAWEARTGNVVRDPAPERDTQ